MKPLSAYEEQQLRRIRGPFAPATPLAEAHQLLAAIRRSGKLQDANYKARRERNESSPVQYERRKRGLPGLPDFIPMANGRPSSQVA